MKSDATSVEEYLEQLPADRRTAVEAVRDVVNRHLPDGYREAMGFGMVTWAVPLETYPDTYNGQPLMIAALASQKNHLSLYLMGLYTDESELAWFQQQYAARGLKLDMGKSCVRFKRIDQLPLDLVGEVIARITPEMLIARHERARRSR